MQDGRIALRLKTPWHDGTTHVLFEPLDFVAKLAALVPRPRKNLVLYHGVLSANAAWRSRVTSHGRAQKAACNETAPAAEDKLASAAGPAMTRPACEYGAPRSKRRQWAELMRRAFGYDLLACSRCGGKLRLLAIILDHATARKILLHLRLPNEPPALAPARAPPWADSRLNECC